MCCRAAAQQEDTESLAFQRMWSEKSAFIIIIPDPLAEMVCVIFAENGKAIFARIFVDQGYDIGWRIVKGLQNPLFAEEDYFGRHEVYIWSWIP